MNPSFFGCSFMFVEASVDIARLIRASFVPQFEFDFSFYADLKSIKTNNVETFPLFISSSVA